MSLRLFFFIILCQIVTVQCSTFSSMPSRSAWLKASNKISEEFTLDFAKIYPERASSMGFVAFDKKATSPTVKNHELYLKKLKQWETKVKHEVSVTSDLNLKTDLQILLESIKQSLQSERLKKDEKHVPVSKVSQRIFYGISSLVQDQYPLARKQSAVDRFKSYMNSSLSYIQASQQTLIFYEKEYKGQTGPFSYPSQDELKKYLENSPTFVSGIEELLSKTGRKDWKEAFQRFESEVLDYDEFIKTNILPKAPPQPQISRKAYELRLKAYGNFTSPEQLLQEGEKQFKKHYLELKSLAEQIGKKHNLKKRSPYSISLFLKKNPVKTTEAALDLYKKADQRLEKIIKENDLVTLPKRPLLIRIGSDAESKASPVPHLNVPPLVNNKGETPEFVVPTGGKNNPIPYDDFAHPSMAIALTAHEGRPGHDLQFQQILESPLSLIRTNYAFNSVNVEGWALYAEQIMFPYLNLEEKFGVLQSKMWRIARYFLDPKVQLGQANERFVIQILHHQLGLSKALAQSEYERYAYRSPGQAPSYYQGFLNIVDLRKDLEERFDAQLNSKCFHDTLLSFGLMPHNKIQEHFQASFAPCKK